MPMVQEVKRMAKKKKAARDRIDLRAEPEWVARVERQAARMGQTVSSYIRRAVTEKLEADEATEPEGKK